MLKLFTVCGNGLGSSLMLKVKMEEICQDHGISADIQAIDLNSAKGISADLMFTSRELAVQLDRPEVVVVRSYINKRKIEADVLDMLKNKAAA